MAVLIFRLSLRWLTGPGTRLCLHHQNGRQVRFRELNLRRTTDRKALFQLLRQIRDGQIRPVAASKDDPLADFAFCGEEVDRFIKGAIGPAPLTARDVTELTGWKHECVTHWCKEGLLKSSQERRGGADTYFIRHQDLIEFQKGFVVVSDVARELGSLSKHIISRAADCGTRRQVARCLAQLHDVTCSRFRYWFPDVALNWCAAQYSGLLHARASAVRHCMRITNGQGRIKS